MKLGPKKIRLAVAPIAWINDDIVEWGGLYTLEQCLQQSAEAGYVATEAGRSFPEKPQVLSKKLTAAGLEMAAGWWSGMLRTGTLKDEIARIDGYLNMFHECGTDIMFYGEIDGSIQGDATPLSQRLTMKEEEFKRYGARLNELARHTKRHGIKLCFHHHMGSVVQSVADVDCLMANTSTDLGLLVDTGHMVFAGGNPAQLVRKHAARVCYIHCKDLRKNKLDTCLAEDWAFTRAVRESVFTVPGDGFLDFDAFFKELAAIKYSGWIVVEAEQNPHKANPLKYSILGREHLEPLLDQYSFTVVDEQDGKK